MARRSRYLHYDEQMTALMKRGNLSQIPADRNHTRGSVIEKLKMLGAAKPVRGKLILQLHIASSNGHFCGLKRTRSEASRRHLNCSWLVPYPNRLRCQECPAHRLFLTSQTVRVPSQAKQFMFVRSYRRVSADKRTSVRLSAQNATACCKYKILGE